jgi:hypothetical protein
MIINAGIIKVVHQGNFDDPLALQFMQEAGIEVIEKRPGSGHPASDHDPNSSRPVGGNIY